MFTLIAFKLLFYDSQCRRFEIFLLKTNIGRNCAQEIGYFKFGHVSRHLAMEMSWRQVIQGHSCTVFIKGSKQKKYNGIKFIAINRAVNILHVFQIVREIHAIAMTSLPLNVKLAPCTKTVAHRAKSCQMTATATAQVKWRKFRSFLFINFLLFIFFLNFRFYLFIYLLGCFKFACFSH